MDVDTIEEDSLDESSILSASTNLKGKEMKAQAGTIYQNLDQPSKDQITALRTEIARLMNLLGPEERVELGELDTLGRLARIVADGIDRLYGTCPVCIYQR